MSKLAIINQKGGSGKSQLATGIASLADAEGAAVIIIDTDDRQASASWWESIRPGEDIAVVSSGVGALPLTVGKAEKAGADLILIDTPANARDIATAAAEIADFVIVPVVPKPTDLQSVKTTVAQLQQTGTPFALVLNMVKYTGTEAEDTAAIFADMGVTVLAQRLHDRKDFYNAAGSGLGVVEYDPKGKAAAEFQAVYDEVKRLSGISFKRREQGAA